MVTEMSKKEVNMLSGSIMKGLLTIAIPIMIMNVLQNVFSIIDMTILKMYDTDGGYSVGAVGACLQGFLPAQTLLLPNI